MPATDATNEFFCLSCGLIGELDLHGRCSTCGSDAVTHPVRYELHFLEADACCMREKKVPLTLNLEGDKECNRNSIFSVSWHESSMAFRKITNAKENHTNAHDS